MSQTATAKEPRSVDDILRSHKFVVESRPRRGPTVWVRKFTEQEALEFVEWRLKQLEKRK